MFEAINGMLLDMLAAGARKDYDDRRRRQAQGQARAKAEARIEVPNMVFRDLVEARMLSRAGIGKPLRVNFFRLLFCRV